MIETARRLGTDGNFSELYILIKEMYGVIEDEFHLMMVCHA